VVQGEPKTQMQMRITRLLLASIELIEFMNLSVKLNKENGKNPVTK
jgi:hypothetical protein